MTPNRRSDPTSGGPEEPPGSSQGLPSRDSRTRSPLLRWGIGIGTGVMTLAIAVLLVAWTLQPETLPEAWAPPEAVHAPAAPALAAVPSTLRVPVVAGPDVISSLLESQVPRRFGDLGEALSVDAVPGLTFAFEAERSAVESRVVGDRLSLRTEVAYEARGRWDSGFLPSMGGGCPVGDEPRPRMEIVLTVAPELSSEWVVDAELEVVSVRPVSDTGRDRCRLGGSSLDVTDALSALVEEELTRALPELRSQLQSLDVSSLLATQWSRLEDPIAIGPEAWLSLGPQGLALGGISGENGAFRMDAELTLQPRVLLLSDVDDKPASNPVESPEQGLSVEVIAGFAELSRAIRDHMGGELLTVAGREVEVRDVRVWGLDDGRLVAEVALARGFQGTVWGAGTPTLSADGTLTLPDLEFVLATSNPLAMLATRGFRSSLEVLLRDRLRWSTSHLWRDLGLPVGILLEQELFPGIVLEGTVEDISLDTIQVSAAGVRLTVRPQVDPRIRVASFW